MGTGPGDLNTLAQTFLTACIGALDTIPIAIPPLDGAPSRAFVAPGLPAADCCPQLTVHAQSLGEFYSSAPPPKASDARINGVLLIATLFRCVPTLTESGDPPSMNAQIAAGLQLDADGWALFNHLYEQVRTGVLFEKCKPVVWEGFNALVPSGACGGWTVAVRVNLDGYVET